MTHPNHPVRICVHESLHPGGLDRLRSMNGVIVSVCHVHSPEEKWSISDSMVREVEVLFSTMPPENLDEATRLRLLQIGSVGYSHLYGLNLPDRGIRVCNAAGTFDAPIAEWNVGMMINLARDLPAMIRIQNNGGWERTARFQREISESVVGLWGYGGIGRETARLCKAMGMKVHALTRSRDNEPFADRRHFYCVNGKGDPSGTLPDRVFSLEEKFAFLESVDFLILALPLTAYTEGMIGESELRALRPSAFVLNPARGPLIQKKPLIRALQEGWIAGAALDTHYDYPVAPDDPLRHLPNVIMTPHISGSSETQTYLRRVWDIFVTNVERYVLGKPLLNELNAKQLRNQS